ncbi:MAG: glycoside hydrolase 43 family protein [Lachnospiraceae bacterium]|nr:glycoside hydrolase 43 family protein [Lachnospiraceae bacterium]
MSTDKTLYTNFNPITSADYPDVDVICVDDTYYMVSTTMYFMPGCEILRSYDLIHWEHAAFVYDRLDSTPAQQLKDDLNIYGQGMWAASLRYHDGTFYVCFVANDTHKTYLYRAQDIRGPWKKSLIDGFYHDNSILFDDDGRVYIVYGNRQIYLTELKADLSGPKEGGLHRMIVEDREDSPLGYEGSHIYKIDGRYYVFFINIPKGGPRTQSVYMADSPEGEFKGKIVLQDDNGYHGSGVAQGGIVQTPSGDWYAILFQDSGAVGRIPFLIPVTWDKEHWPVFGVNGKIPASIEVKDLNPGHDYKPLVHSDEFRATDGDSFGFDSSWQFNHEPDLNLVSIDPGQGTVRITTDKVCTNLVQAKNTLTQRTLFPRCEANVTVNGKFLKEGDIAGLCLLESEYGFIALYRKDGKLRLVVCRRFLGDVSFWGERHDVEPPEELASVPVDHDTVTVGVHAEFDDMTDTGYFYYVSDGERVRLGPEIKLRFLLDHFTGVRFGLFIYSTKECGGSAEFSRFERS